MGRRPILPGHKKRCPVVHGTETVLDTVIFRPDAWLIGEPLTLADLAEQSGTAARTIRFYIARGLLDGPVKAGRSAVYTADHLARLGRIKALQTEGRTLTEITHLITERAAALTPVTPTTAWHQHVPSDDVMVFVRADAAPWRMKQIRNAIHEFRTQLESNPERKDSQ